MEKQPSNRALKQYRSIITSYLTQIKAAFVTGGNIVAVEFVPNAGKHIGIFVCAVGCIYPYAN